MPVEGAQSEHHRLTGFNQLHKCFQFSEAGLLHPPPHAPVHLLPAMLRRSRLLAAFEEVEVGEDRLCKHMQGVGPREEVTEAVLHLPRFAIEVRTCWPCVEAMPFPASIIDTESGVLADDHEPWPIRWP